MRVVQVLQLLLIGLASARAALPPCDHSPDCKAAATCQSYGGPNTESQAVFDTICLNNVRWAEPAFSGQYDNFWEQGTYKCACCGQEVYSSEHKYDSRSGWPAYYDTIESSAVLINPSDGELVCSRCGAHLGHRFDDGPKETTGLRDCINSACLTFVPDNSTQPLSLTTSDQVPSESGVNPPQGGGGEMGVSSSAVAAFDMKVVMAAVAFCQVVANVVWN